MRHSMRALVALIAPALFAPGAPAALTQVWEVRTAAQFAEGRPEGAVVTSAGEVRTGWLARRIELRAESVWCVLPDGRGGALAGTGPKGEIYRIDAEKAERIAETGQLAVTVLRQTPEGTLAGTIPEGRIYRLDEEGKLSEFLRLDAKYVWDIAVARDGAVYVATGPEGKLFRIVDGKAELWFKSKEPNLLCLAPAGAGGVYVGSGEKGLLFRVTGKDSAAVVHDFDENELRAIVERGDELVIAANSAKSKAGVTPPSERAAQTSDVKAPSPAEKKDAAPPPSKEPMDCAVYRLSRDGAVEAVFSSKGEFIWALAALADGSVLAATGERGRVYRLQLPELRGAPVIEDGGADVLFDLEEGQALALGVEFGALSFVGTGNGGAVYRVSPREPGSGVYTSKVLDAKTVASWGRLEWDGSGRVRLETRSGATPEPDDAWDGWRALDEGSRVASGRARYLQFRATLGGPGSLLRAVRIAYAPDNQRPTVSAVEFAPAVGEGGKDAKKESAAPALPVRTTVKTVKWTAKDPDGDELVFRLFYRLADAPEEDFRPMTPRGEPVTGDKYAWETRGLPDGRYVVRVVASDERANVEGRSRAAARDSEPTLVDNTPPEIPELRVERGEITGFARDAASRIAHLSYAIDGGDARLLGSEDGLLDSREERFRFALPAGLARGLHAIVVHAADEAGNLAVARTAFRVE